MKKMKYWLAATLICGAGVFAACSKGDNRQPSDTWDAKTGTLTVNSNPGKDAYSGRTDIVSVVFGDAVTGIGDRAFYNCPISVVDLPASVVSIGSEAFAGEDSELDIVTIHATDCTFGEHPFQQSIMTNIYVPAASLAAYETKYPEYSEKTSQFHAIPEAKQEGNEIIWSNALCKYIQVWIPYNHKDRIIAAHNTQGGITVNFAITDEDSGFGMGSISLVQGEKLTFTSTVGNISRITIQADFDEEDEPDTPVAEGWTWNAAKHTFTWQGKPSASVEMIAGADVDLQNVQIRFDGTETLTFKVKNSSDEFILKKVEGGDYSMEYMYDGQVKTVTGTLSDFYISPVEVTNKLWADVMGFRPEGQSNNGDAYPVSNVNYYDIAGDGGFIDKLNAMCKGQLPEGKRFALPTEAQWEYAARGGQKSKGYKYAGSNSLDEVAWYAENSDGSTHPVGLKQPNELGLYDMTGNVWEWTRDHFLYFDKLTLDQGLNYVCNADNNYRVNRGGSYGTRETGLETAYHTWLGMHQSYISRGLRLVLVDDFEEDTIVEPAQPDNLLSISVNNGTVGYFLPMVEVKGGDYELVYERVGEQKTFSGTLSDFYICQTETMNYIWETVMGSTPQGQSESEGLYPVTMVNFEDITGSGGFLEKLNTMCADQLPAGMQFALATEAEWHYAASGGRKSQGYTYAGSNTISDVAWYADNGGGASHFVASRQPNELGLYDLSGNVWEYCNDWYADLADLPADQGTDYAGPVSGEKIAGCGGCYSSETYTCTSAYHGREKEHNGRDATLGFRIVLR